MVYDRQAMTRACGTCIQVMNRYEDIKVYRRVAFPQQELLRPPTFTPGSQQWYLTVQLEHHQTGS